MTGLEQSAHRVTRAHGVPSDSRRVVGPTWRRLLAVAACATLGVVVASCDASKALSPGGRKDVQIEFQGDSTLVVGSTVPVQFGVLVDGKPYAYPRLEVVSADTS